MRKPVTPMRSKMNSTQDLMEGRVVFTNVKVFWGIRRE